MTWAHVVRPGCWPSALYPSRPVAFVTPYAGRFRPQRTTCNFVCFSASRQGWNLLLFPLHHLAPLAVDNYHTWPDSMQMPEASTLIQARIREEFETNIKAS